MHLSPQWLMAAVRSKTVVLFWLNCCWLLLPLWDSVIVLCFVVRFFVSKTSFANILMGKRGLVVLHCLSFWWFVSVAVPWVCLQFVIVVFPDHTDLLYVPVNKKNRITKLGEVYTKYVLKMVSFGSKSRGNWAARLIKSDEIWFLCI